MWLNNSPLPAELCEREPALKQYGFYRRLNDGKFEFISYCNEKAGKMVSIWGPTFDEILDALLPEVQQPQP